jgi:ABC-type transporter Mla MlaB component
MSAAEKGACVRLVFAEDLTAATFDRMRDQLVEALIASDKIELELGNIRNVDRSLVELMCSVHRVAESMGKSFTFGSAATVRRIQELACDQGYADTPCKYRAAGCLYRDGSAGIVRMEEE